MVMLIICYDMYWETFFQDVEHDGTDISGDIDLAVRVHIQSDVDQILPTTRTG